MIVRRAASGGQVKLVRYLWKVNESEMGQPRDTTTDGLTPLELAAGGATDAHTRVASFLLHVANGDVEDDATCGTVTLKRHSAGYYCLQKYTSSFATMVKLTDRALEVPNTTLLHQCVPCERAHQCLPHPPSPPPFRHRQCVPRRERAHHRHHAGPPGRGGQRQVPAHPAPHRPGW